MRASTVLLLVVLAGCTRAKPDPRIAENVSPHLVVRVIDRAAEAPCDRDHFVDTLRCWVTRAPRVGCVYAETGDALDHPLLRARRQRLDCDGLAGQPGRLLVASEPLTHVTLHADERHDRVLLQAGDVVWLFTFFNGALLDTRTLTPRAGSGLGLYNVDFAADGTPDWARVPTLFEVAAAHAEALSDDDLDALARATPDGAAELERGVVKAFSSRALTPDDPAWPRLARRLSESSRALLEADLLASLQAGEAPAVRWAQMLPVRREALVEALVACVSTERECGAAAPEAFTLLARLAPARLTPLACHSLEAAWFDADAEDVSLATASTALAIIAREKLACPWVRPWLLRVPCAWQLREYTLDDEAPTTPLVSEKTRRWAIALELDSGEREGAPPPTPGDDAFAPGAGGALVPAAATAQGPLPPEFELRDARRFYRRVYAQPEEAGDPCHDAGDTVAELACQLPPSMHELRREGCAITLDDARRVMTLRSEGR